MSKNLHWHWTFLGFMKTALLVSTHPRVGRQLKLYQDGLGMLMDLVDAMMLLSSAE